MVVGGNIKGNSKKKGPAAAAPTWTTTEQIAFDYRWLLLLLLLLLTGWLLLLGRLFYFQGGGGAVIFSYRSDRAPPSFFVRSRTAPEHTLRSLYIQESYYYYTQHTLLVATCQLLWHKSI